MTKVFVYGTLKKGRGNDRLLNGAKFLGNARTTSGAYTMYQGGYPMVLADGLFHISGELYEVDNPKILESLDRLEGHPDFFHRHSVSVSDVHGQDHDAFMYVVPPRFVTGRNPVQPDHSNTCEW